MSDSGSRRQPPSPLVFSPETVLQSVQSTNSSSHAVSSAASASSSTVSMPFVRRHVTRRLKAAKADCDKELHRITNTITVYFEQKMREADAQREQERELRGREREYERELQREMDRGRYHEPYSSSPEAMGEPPYMFPSSDLRSALLSDDASSDGGQDFSQDGESDVRSRRHSRQPSRHTASTDSSSPAPLRRQNSHSVSATESYRRHSNAMPPPPLLTSQSSQQGAMVSRRLSRTIHIPTRPVHSGQSSRSTSRSRSPLPPPAGSSYSDSYSDRGAPSPSVNRRASRILVDDPIDPIMTALYDLIALATDVCEMTITQLTAKPKACATLVQRVQAIGRAWEDHPDWHGRSWYVQVLLAVASLSRVVEWYEAEKQFWNFDDDEQDEPLSFVTKPLDDEDKAPSPAGGELCVPNDGTGDRGGALGLTASDDESKLTVGRGGRRSRDEVRDQDASGPAKEQDVPLTSKLIDTAESARVLATERLRLQAETAQNRNIVIELNMDGEHLLWVNHAWRYVIGSEPEDLPGTGVSRLLHPRDVTVFHEATKQLEEDDSHTIEVRFRLAVETEGDSGRLLYLPMEGKGMLMIDREDGHHSHTMWVIKPVGPLQDEDANHVVELEGGEIGDEPEDTGERSFAGLDPLSPFPVQRPNLAAILCRICECSIPTWYFEKHNETCSEVHRLEAEIVDCNESIGELRNTIRELTASVDGASPANTAEYRGMPIFSPSTSPNQPSPLQMFRSPLTSKMARMGIKKLQRRLLEQLEDILQVASEVSVPALKEDESKEPIERQRLLSPASERKMSQVRNWYRPATEDAALAQLVDDAERVMRQKIDNVVRMQNTIRYSEKVRQEWEARVEKTLASFEAEEDCIAPYMERTGGSSGGGSDYGGFRGSASSTTSEYAFNGDEATAQPSPLASSASSSPSPTPVGPHRSLSEGLALAAPRPAPAHPRQAAVSAMQNARSSTPSSLISSPLALVPPIVASPSPPPPMDLNDTDAFLLRSQRSAPNLQPRLLLTPPLSPMNSPKDATTKRTHRRQSTATSILSPTVPTISPKIPSVAPSATRTTPTSIKDFEIIKPISKGAFGSVFLAKKKATGDYYAIKVLKKADMVAKNQVTNVKAERMILMTQAESPFVAKLYFTFQSKENLYLVMEYLNGGDCAALIKSLGSLPEEWAKNYIAEVVLGLESLHQREVVHRDLKPDNLLIDQHGHLKLTDFGLSRIGLLGRQTRDAQPVADKNVTENKNARPPPRASPGSRPPSMDLTQLMNVASMPSSDLLHLGGSYFSPKAQPLSRHGSSPYLFTDDSSESSGSEFHQTGVRKVSVKANESPLTSFATELTNDLRSHAHAGALTPPAEQKFVGTPDYLAPETILGLRGDDAAVDWWALGVITYEFLYGIPPFHDETPEKVFENILSGHIEWHEDIIEYSSEARDFMQRLMTADPTKRLGSNGADEVKAHPWFAGIDWDKVTTTEAAFIPQVTDPESTDYFDPRGAIPQLFHDEDMVALKTPADSPAISPDPSINATAVIVPVVPVETGSPDKDDFGSFNFKNLGVLKQANDDVIRKLRTDQMAPMAQALSEPSSSFSHTRKRSVSHRIKKPPSVVTSFDPKTMSQNPPSPATSTSSIASSPSRASMPPSTPGSAGGSGHARKPSEYGAVERFKHGYIDGDVRRPNATPSRLRTASMSTCSADDSVSDYNPSSTPAAPANHFEVHTPPSSVGSLDLRSEKIDATVKPEAKMGRAPVDLRKKPDPHDRAVTCLLAEDNPITAKIIETLLIRLGCRCVVVADGSEAISVAMGDIKFDCILMDLQMPVLDGEGAARYIKSTNGKNTNTPIIAVSAYSAIDPPEGNTLFSGAISKPVQKADLLAIMRQIGFKTSAAPAPGTKPAATRKASVAAIAR